jgi:hypothetical protein
MGDDVVGKSGELAAAHAPERIAWSDRTLDAAYGRHTWRLQPFAVPVVWTFRRVPLDERPPGAQRPTLPQPAVKGLHSLRGVPDEERERHVADVGQDVGTDLGVVGRPCGGVDFVELHPALQESLNRRLVRATFSSSASASNFVRSFSAARSAARSARSPWPSIRTLSTRTMRSRTLTPAAWQHPTPRQVLRGSGDGWYRPLDMIGT